MKVRHREGGDGGREGTVGRGVGGRVWFGLLGFNASATARVISRVGGREEGEGRKEILPGGAELIESIDPK